MTWGYLLCLWLAMLHSERTQVVCQPRRKYTLTYPHNRCPHLLQLPAFLTGYVWCEARFLLLCFPWNAYAGHTTYTQHITHNTQTTCTTHTHHTWHAQHIYTLQNAVVQVVNGITWFQLRRVCICVSTFFAATGSIKIRPTVQIAVRAMNKTTSFKLGK